MGSVVGVVELVAGVEKKRVDKGVSVLLKQCCICMFSCASSFNSIESLLKYSCSSYFVLV